MGKARTDKYGRTREQKLLYENQQLKKQIGSLRKQIARLDLNRYDVIREIIEENYQHEKAAEGRQILENLKKTWICHECYQGVMEIFVYNRSDGTFYYRICSNSPNCKNRTKSQPYSPNISGIIRGNIGKNE